MQGLALLFVLGWLVNTPWAMILVVGVILAGIALVAWVWMKQILDIEPAASTWNRVEPRFERSSHRSQHRRANNGQDAGTDHSGRKEETVAAPEDVNPFADMDEDALARFIANLVHKNTALEKQVTELKNRIAALEADAADVPSRLREAVTSGREQVLHAFGYNREEFESMLREFNRKEQTRTHQEQQRQERQRQEDAARKRREQSQQRSRSAKPWWEILGVAPDATEDAVRRAYRSLVKRYHPDRGETGDAQRMAEINAARDEAMSHFGKVAERAGL